MAYVVRRTTKAGSLSTALVESYRDEQGRPRQRVLANLHGEPTLLKALAKLTVLRDVLCEETESLLAEAKQVNDGNKADRLRKQLLQVANRLETIGKDGTAIEQHCTATSDEIQDATRVHAQKFMDIFHKGAGLGYALAQQLKTTKAALRRLST